MVQVRSIKTSAIGIHLKLTNMQEMFDGAGSFNQDRLVMTSMSDFKKMLLVTNMERRNVSFADMFSAFNQPIGKWNLSSASGSMWDVSAAFTKMDGMFSPIWVELSI